MLANTLSGWLSGYWLLKHRLQHVPRLNNFRCQPSANNKAECWLIIIAGQTDNPCSQSSEILLARLPPTVGWLVRRIVVVIDMKPFKKMTIGTHPETRCQHVANAMITGWLNVPERQQLSAIKVVDTEDTKSTPLILGVLEPTCQIQKLLGCHGPQLSQCEGGLSVPWDIINTKWLRTHYNIPTVDHARIKYKTDLRRRKL